MTRLQRAFLVSVAVLLLPMAASADIIASDYQGGGFEAGLDFSIGWEFTLSDDVIVESLGVYDLGPLGFADSHDIGIFRTSDSATIVSTSIASGLSGTFVAGTEGGTRFVDVADTVLEAGVQYYILANNFMVDEYAFGFDPAVTFSEEITWLGFVTGSTNSIFSTATNNGGLPGSVGPNFSYSVSVPEPSTLALLGIGLFGMALSRRRRKQLA